MKDILALDKLSENTFLNLATKFLYYAMLVLIVFSTIWAFQVRGEAQGVFVLGYLILYGFFISPLVLLVRIYLRIKKIEISSLFKHVSSRMIWLPWVSFWILIFVVA